MIPYYAATNTLLDVSYRLNKEFINFKLYAGYNSNYIKIFTNGLTRYDVHSLLIELIRYEKDYPIMVYFQENYIRIDYKEKKEND